MPVNFFDETQKTSSTSSLFGLCDDPPPAKNPAYIDEDNKDLWIGIVENPTHKETEFYPIDNCVPLYKANGNPESRCDGLLRFNNNLLFIELKTGHSGWLADGRGQLAITIQKFAENHDISNFAKVEAYLCNSLRPMATKNHGIEIQKFKDKTGLILLKRPFSC